jgi:hypothetical protein
MIQRLRIAISIAGALQRFRRPIDVFSGEGETTPRLGMTAEGFVFVSVGRFEDGSGGGGGVEGRLGGGRVGDEGGLTGGLLAVVGGSEGGFFGGAAGSFGGRWGWVHVGVGGLIGHVVVAGLWTGKHKQEGEEGGDYFVSAAMVVHINLCSRPF